MRPTDSPARILIVSYACDPYSSMESRLGWNRAMASSQRYDTTVICDSKHKERIAKYLSIHGDIPRLSFLFEGHDPRQRRWMSNRWLKYSAYHRWHIRAYQRARAIHEGQPWDLVHQVGFCGYREPGYGWKLGVPFLWGPIGGTDDVPIAFLASLGVTGAVSELVRRCSNYVQLRTRRRVRKAVRHAAQIWVANSSAESKIESVWDCNVERLLETGLEAVAEPIDRRQRSGPLRLVWSGRFCAWKGFPLVLRALRNVLPRTDVELRVIGYGPYELQYQSLARRLGINQSIEWLGWPDWESTFQHYQWADAFLFSSLRDTSGTGLLEALTHGCPIVGLDHQGARDIMTDRCSIQIPITYPVDVVNRFSGCNL